MATAPRIALPEIALPGTLWIAADVHLQPDTPDILAAFLAFVDVAGRQADALLLPGDIFDAWIGDDVLDTASPWLGALVDALSRTGQAIPLWIGHGNRDFLIGERLAAAAHARLLPAQACLVTDYGRVLLTHGDELCTDDFAYQQMRTVVRNPAWQADILARPLPERLQIAAQLRARSESGKAAKAMEIMDVNQDAVERLMRDTGIRRLIHGHTHRPGRQVFLLDGQPAERWVLPDWRHEGAALHGGWISLDRDGPALHDLLA